MLYLVIIYSLSIEVPWSFLVFCDLESFEEYLLFYRMSIDLDCVMNLEGDGALWGRKPEE